MHNLAIGSYSLNNKFNRIISCNNTLIEPKSLKKSMELSYL